MRRDPVRDDLTSAMVCHWQAGLRGSAFHAAVRREHPDVDLGTYNACADRAWAMVDSDAADAT